jgi:hypothetical protein
MRYLTLALTPVFCCALATAGVAQNAAARTSADGLSEPKSTAASNIDSSDSHSTYAKQLPSPGLADGSTPDDYLRSAQRALRSNHTGAAQEALERAETRTLDRSYPNGDSAVNANPRVAQLSASLHALAAGDKAQTNQLIATMLNDPHQGS